MLLKTNIVEHQMNFKTCSENNEIPPLPLPIYLYYN